MDSGVTPARAQIGDRIALDLEPQEQALYPELRATPAVEAIAMCRGHEGWHIAHDCYRVNAEWWPSWICGFDVHVVSSPGGGQS